MNRINLVIADSDGSYLDSLANIMLSGHSRWFQISTFTKIDSLTKILKNSTHMVDILLIEPSLYSDDLPLDNVNLVFILGNSRLNEDFDEFTIIDKYQPVDTLVADIIRNHTEKSQGNIINITGDKNTKLIGVYSPVGGAGKSSLSVNLSVQCAANNKSVFYLNLEDINSTHNYFTNTSDKNLSNVLFYLKEKGKNLGQRINALRSLDDSKVYYFPTQDSMLDMNDMTPDEMSLLITELIKIGQYDYIFVDMSTSLSKNNIAIFRHCDKIVYLLTPDLVAKEKSELLEKDFQRVLNIPDQGVFEKILLVANKYKHNNTWVEDYMFLDNEVRYKIPYENNFKPNGLNNSSRFNNEILGLLNEIK